MKPVAYAVTWVLLIFATCWNAFLVYRLSAAARDFFPDSVLTAFTAPIGLMAGAAAFSAIQIGTGNKPFALHPMLSILSLLNFVFPAGRLIAAFWP